MSDHKRICIYSPWMMPLGGIETHLVNLSCHLATQGWGVNFCVKYSAITKATAGRLAATGVRYHRFPLPSFFRHTLLSKSLLYTNSQGNTSPLIWKYGGAGRVGFHHCHTACSDEERKTWEPRYREFISEGPPLVACSQTTADNIRELNSERVISVLPYFAMSEEIPVEQMSFIKKYDPSFLHFGFVGRVERSKGIDLIIQASQHPEFSNIKWHVFGSGGEAERVQAASGKTLIYHGAFDHSMDLSEIYGQLDALVLPSSHVEGSPLCLIEALAFGKPWIAANRGGVKELVGSAEDCQVIDQVNFSSFIDAVSHIRLRLKQKAVNPMQLRTFYSSHFSPTVVREKWLYFINKLRKDV